MGIDYFRNNGCFEPEATEAMGRAFEAVCQLKPNVSRELIANRIIELAKRGERDASRLCAQVLGELTPDTSRRERGAAQPFGGLNIGANFLPSH
jgi:hypothetical protein